VHNIPEMQCTSG